MSMPHIHDVFEFEPTVSAVPTVTHIISNGRSCRALNK